MSSSISIDSLAASEAKFEIKILTELEKKIKLICFTRDLSSSALSFASMIPAIKKK